MAQLPTQFELLALLSYDAESGSLTWRARPASMFTNGPHSAEHQAAKWNALHAGKNAAIIAAGGDAYTTIATKKHLSHKIAWKMHFNTEPAEIGHINHDRTDIRIRNLRPTDRDASMRNMKRSKRNSSGATGVSYRADRGVWRAYLRVDGKQKALGHFDSFEQAEAARLEASERFGYHANHGTL